MTSYSQRRAASPYLVRPVRAEDLDRLVILLLALQDHLEASNPALWQVKFQARVGLQTRLKAQLSEPD